MKNIYYLGPEGSYSSLLAKKCYPDESQYQIIDCKDFYEVTEKVISNPDSLGVLPIENLSTSSVHESMDYLFNKELIIVKEAYLKFKLYLIGLVKAQLKNIKVAYSHPNPLRQSSKFLQKHHIKTEKTTSTTAGRDLILEEDDDTKACIGDSRLAKQNELKILAEDIANFRDNCTRFVFVEGEKKGADYPSNLKGDYKASFKFKIKHQPGSLARVLTEIAKLHINLTKIESRPVADTNWEYDFWVDVEWDNVSLSDFQELLKKNTLSYKIKGVYNKGKTYKSWE